jgi:MFS family permease
VGDLRRVLAERNFRRLFATRLVSQFGDGLFNAGVGTYVFFGRTTFPNPGAAATAFAVLYLPYSLIGPFAGVFIDRWSRRQILVWSVVLRAALVVVTASLMAAGRLGAPLYVSVLLVLGVNRFFLSSLSAALPHVVSEDTLVMANSVGPTSGTIATFLGALAGLGAHLVHSNGTGQAALTLLAAAVFYLLAGAVGATMGRGLLGPPPLAEGEHRAGLLSELAVVARGLVSGARHVWQRRQAAAALGATGSQRAMYGILFLAAILLYRNYFYRESAANTSLAHFILVVVAAAIGFGAAAVITPMATRRMSQPAWIALMLALGGVVTGIFGPFFKQASFLVVALVLGVVSQGVAICATTVLQQQIGDSYRGRVFALYDMLFNVPYVLGAVIAARFIPNTGKSQEMIAVVAAGYLTASVLYAFACRRQVFAGPDQDPGSSGGEPGPASSGAASSGAASSGEGAPGPGASPAPRGGSWPDASPSASAQPRNS